MTDDPSDGQASERPTEFEWSSPRWQENDAVPGDVERHRRARLDPRPRQRGAIDQEGSVSPSRAGEGKANGEAPEAQTGNAQKAPADETAS